MQVSKMARLPTKHTPFSTLSFLPTASEHLRSPRCNEGAGMAGDRFASNCGQEPEGSPYLGQAWLDSLEIVQSYAWPMPTLAFIRLAAASAGPVMWPRFPASARKRQSLSKRRSFDVDFGDHGPDSTPDTRPRHITTNCARFARGNETMLRYLDKVGSLTSLHPPETSVKCR